MCLGSQARFRRLQPGCAMTSPDGAPPRLSAIVFTDVVGYSARMGRDEAGTIARVQADFEALRTACAACGGEVLNTMGDGMLLAFSSALQAARFALDAQASFESRRLSDGADEPLMHRIGIHIGDVYRMADGTIAGDGVNIAARLEARAPAGGVCVSQAVYDLVRGRLPMQVQRLGEEQLKNISQPVAAWLLGPERASAAAPRGTGGSNMAPFPQETVMSQSAAPRLVSIAVLPFVNMSSDPENEYFSDGLSEELLNVLVKVTNLRVTARTSSFAFKGKSMQVRDIARALGVDHLLEGSVRKAGHRVRVTAQLIRAGDDAHLWSETYDRQLDDIFAVQDDISHEVVQALKIKLVGATPSVTDDGGTSDLVALEHYLRARHLLDRSPDEVVLRAALAALDLSVKQDPLYARAYNEQAKAWILLGDQGHVPLAESHARAQAALDLALRISPDMGEALVCRGFLNFHALLDVSRATMDYERALQVSPGNAEVQSEVAHFLAACGKVGAAIAAARMAVSLDPLKPGVVLILARVLNSARQFAEAEEVARSLLAMAGRGHGVLGWSLLFRGRCQEALAQFDAAGAGIAAKAGRICSLAVLRQDQQARMELTAMQDRYGDAACYQYAQILCLLGDVNGAIAALERARDVRDAGLMALVALDPALDGLRSEPRFMALVTSLGLMH